MSMVKINYLGVDFYHRDQRKSCTNIGLCNRVVMDILTYETISLRMERALRVQQNHCERHFLILKLLIRLI
jgi:hypothetical protein